MSKITFKMLLPIILLCGIATISCSQEQKTDKQNLIPEKEDLYFYRNYHCFDFVKQCELEMLKLIGFDTLIYVSSSQFHGSYEEIQGKLNKINDSIYFVQTFKHLVQRGNGDKPFRVVKDSVFFYCDSSLINSNLRIEYTNGNKEEYKIYSTENVFWINEEYFNKNNERIYLSFDYKKPVVDETVELVSKYSEKKYSISFRSIRQPHDFYIIVKPNHVKTLNIGNESHQCSGAKFKLDKMALRTHLPGNRKIYD